jgi:4-alpha-glucanotransferase
LIYEFKQDHFIFFWDFWKKESYINLSEEVKSKLFPLSELNLKEDEELWQKAGSAILELFSKHSNMTPCAEDLGSVPTFIRESLFELQMMGIDVVRWTRSFETGEFIPNDGYRKLAISTLSTHDTSLAMDWWKNEGDFNEKLNFFFLEQGKPVPKNDDEVLLGLLDFVFHTESVFSIQLMSDLCLFESEISSDPAGHRINIPGTPDSENWNYRFPFTIEEFAKNTERNQILRKLLLSSDRM